MEKARIVSEQTDKTWSSRKNRFATKITSEKWRSTKPEGKHNQQEFTSSWMRIRLSTVMAVQGHTSCHHASIPRHKALLADQKMRPVQQECRNTIAEQNKSRLDRQMESSQQAPAIFPTTATARHLHAIGAHGALQGR